MRRRDQPTEFHATAPVRLDFAGGWTDVPPFSAREGGVVINAALRLAVHVELKLGGPRLRLEARDLGEVVEFERPSDVTMDGRLVLHRAAVRMFPVQMNCAVATWSDIPPGSGLGSSGALDVALVAALARARGDHFSERELAEHAWHLETVEAQIPGGRQDQFAAAFGGFHRFSFNDPDTGVEPVTLDPTFATVLERQVVLCYTGRSRLSGETIARVMTAYERGDARVAGALRGIKDTAEQMATALRACDLARVGALLSHNWRHQQTLDPEMRTPEMARLEQAMTGAGALGGKAAGAGAGGCMFFLAPNPQVAVAAAREVGATVLPVAWAKEGVRAW